MTTHQPSDKPDAKPATDPSMERWLDRLADAEAASAPSGLEDRLLARTRAEAPPPPLRLATSEQGQQHPNALQWISPARLGIAAAVILVATLSLLWLKPASTPFKTPNTPMANNDSEAETLDQEVDLWLIALDQLDADLSTEIDLLLAETSSFEATLDGSARLPSFDLGDTL